MSGPLIPYITLPEIPLSFLQHLPWLGEWIDPKHPPSIKPFGTLVAIGVYLGAAQVMRRARERGWDASVVSDYLVWAVGSGFVVSHVLDAIFYNPQTVLRDPLYLLKIWDGLSSYGGFIGAVVGSLAFKWYRRQKVLGFVDITVSGMPLAWVFGRSGCAVVHDHPGIKSDVWFAVQYPARGGGFVGRLDLGLLEMVLTIPIAVAVALLWRRNPNRPNGFYIAFVGLVYPPMRFLLDAFRIGPEEAAMGADERYLSLTPAQWASFALFLTGAVFAVKLWRDSRSGSGPTEPGTIPEAEAPVDSSAARVRAGAGVAEAASTPAEGRLDASDEAPAAAATPPAGSAAASDEELDVSATPSGDV